MNDQDEFKKASRYKYDIKFYEFKDNAIGLLKDLPSNKVLYNSIIAAHKKENYKFPDEKLMSDIYRQSPKYFENKIDFFWEIYGVLFIGYNIHKIENSNLKENNRKLELKIESLKKENDNLKTDIKHLNNILNISNDKIKSLRGKVKNKPEKHYSNFEKSDWIDLINENKQGNKKVHLTNIASKLNIHRTTVKNHLKKFNLI